MMKINSVTFTSPTTGPVSLTARWATGNMGLEVLIDTYGTKVWVPIKDIKGDFVVNFTSWGNHTNR